MKWMNHNGQGMPEYIFLFLLIIAVIISGIIIFLKPGKTWVENDSVVMGELTVSSGTADASRPLRDH